MKERQIWWSVFTGGLGCGAWWFRVLARRGKGGKLGGVRVTGRRREEECGAAVAVDGISPEKRRRREWRWSCGSNGLCQKRGKRVLVRLSFGWKRGLSVKRE
ncbi:hypothetical protein HAX54_032665, partial [Datura stramonium]|nr:hypothetical protein [Datura stramonium]